MPWYCPSASTCSSSWSRIGIGDAVDDLRRADQDLDRGHAALAVGPLEQALAHDAAQRGDQRLAGLALLAAGKRSIEAA